MTILDASNLIFQWFAKHHSINLKRDFNKLILISENPADDTACLELALAEYVDSKLVKEKNGFFILLQPFDSFTQKLEIHPSTSLIISNIINKYCELTGNTTENADAKKIQEKDIINLLNIINVLGEIAANSKQNNE